MRVSISHDKLNSLFIIKGLYFGYSSVFKSFQQKEKLLIEGFLLLSQCFFKFVCSRWSQMYLHMRKGNIQFKPFSLTPLQQTTFENIAAKGENAHNAQFLLLPQCLQCYTLICCCMRNRIIIIEHHLNLGSLFDGGQYLVRA